MPPMLAPASDENPHPLRIELAAEETPVWGLRAAGGGQGGRSPVPRFDPPYWASAGNPGSPVGGVTASVSTVSPVAGAPSSWTSRDVPA